MQLADNIEIVVLAHPARPSRTIETLGSRSIPFRVFENENWPLPEEHPERQTDRSTRPSIREYAIWQYQVFRGHQRILQDADPAKYTLVMEDDVSFAGGTALTTFYEHINYGPTFIAEGYDAVSYHGSRLSPAARPFRIHKGRIYARLTCGDREVPEEAGYRYFLQTAEKYYAPKYDGCCFRWHEGSLVYMVGKKGRAKWQAAGHGGGLPAGLFLVNELDTLVARTSLFAQDERYGPLTCAIGDM